LCGGGLTFKNWKNCTDSYCIMFQLGELGALFGGLSPPKPPGATGLRVVILILLKLRLRSWESLKLYKLQHIPTWSSCISVYASRDLRTYNLGRDVCRLRRDSKKLSLIYSLAATASYLWTFYSEPSGFPCCSAIKCHEKVIASG